MIIEELHDFKANHWFDSYRYHEEPLLDYVWQVANKFCPSFDGEMFDESNATAIFANRYFESQLSMEERYQRAKEINPLLCATFEEYAVRQKNYRKLDTSFKEKFLANEDLQNTIEAFGLDISKLWYLLLFIYDYIEDFSTNAPAAMKSDLDNINEFAQKLAEATTIILKKDNRKSLETDRKGTLQIVKSALQYYIETYNAIINKETTREEMLQELKSIGMDGFINSCEFANLEGKQTLEVSFKKWKFAEMFQYFLENKKATTLPHKKVKVSKDKMMFISRLIYTVGYDTKRYNEEYDSEGNKNRMLSNLLRKYQKEKFPTVFGRYYLF